MRAAVLAAVLGLAAGSVAASGLVDVTPRSPARSLQCLQRPAKLPEYPQRSKLDRGYGEMRVRLRFEKPDAPPSIEVLVNTARENMQDEVYRYLSAYRLPCLTPQDGVVSAVQDFSFSNGDRQPVAYEDEEEAPKPPLCVVRPRRDIDGWYSLSKNIEHVVLTMTFDGDGEQPPKVRVIHSTGDRDLADEAAKFAAQYRMPCRHAGDPPRVTQQQFSYVPSGARQYAFKTNRMGLVDFLRMTQDLDKLQADFDFGTMACPFTVEYELYGPALPNEVRAAGKRDPNRAPFLKWLAERQLAFQDARQANALFGSKLQIEVPCGRLALGGS